MSHDLAATSGDVAWTFAYNPAGQITTRGLSNDLYAYDSPALSHSFSRNGLNQYTALGGTAFSHDARGNLTSDGSRAFTYDLENRLIQVSEVGATFTLAYDPLGRLARTTSGAGDVNFVYDGDRLIAEYDGAGQLLRRYVHGPEVDEPLVQYEGSGLSDRRWLLGDHLGSVITTATATGGGGAILAYSAYGEPRNGDWSGPSRFRFTGQMALPDARLYHYRARVYDPVLGRFLQTDPIGYEDGLNLYAYVGNDPFNATDPTGMQSATLTGAAAGCAVTGPGCPAGATVGAIGGLVVDGVTIAVGACALNEGCRDWVGDRAAEVGEFFGSIFENRSREPDPLPEAEGRPHSRPDPNGGYTEYGPNDPQTGRPTSTRQYRPAPGRPHGDVPRPNVKERPPMPRPDGTVRPGRPVVRPPREEEIRPPSRPREQQ